MSKYIDADKLIHDLEERIFAYSEGYAEGDDNRKDAIETLLKDVKYQYSLQQEQPEKPVPNDLKEAANKFAVFYDQGTCDGIAQDCFIAGAKWQAEQAQETIELAEDHAYLAGAEWQKEQMMKEAEEGEIINDNRGNNVVRAGVFNKDFEYGDKVRVIIVKEEN